MNKRKLFKELNELCYEMSESYDINCGGCCFVAACLAEQFEKYNIPYIVCAVYDPTHFCIKVNDRFINRSDYRFKESDYHKNLNSKSLFERYNNESWNYLYRKKWNMIVKSKIISVFIRNENRRERLFYGAFRRNKCKV